MIFNKIFAASKKMLQPSETVSRWALLQAGRNLLAAPWRFYDALIRSGTPRTDRSRSAFVFGNVFLHLHPTRVHRWSLRAATTWGLGMAALASFGILTVTGILLMCYYKPGTEVAYLSIKDIHFVVPTGRFMRNIHRWGAHIMVVAVLLHMVRVFYTAAYRAPREFNWLVGLALFVFTIGLSFTGYLLPWDQLAYWAITIGANIAQSPREITDAIGLTAYFDPGGLQKVLLLGAEHVGEEALIRFYLLHVIVLPLLLAAGLAVHFWRLRKDGGLARPADADEQLGPPDPATYPVFTEAPQKTYALAAIVPGRTAAVGRGPEQTLPSFPHLFYAEAAVIMLTILVTLALALGADAPLKEIANPGLPENPAKAPWYFLGLQELVSHSAFMGGVGLPGFILFALALIPFLDREKEGTGEWFGGPIGRRIITNATAFGFASILIIEAFTIRFGWIRQWWLGCPQLLITLVNPGTIMTALYALYAAWIVHRYNSTRAGSVAFFTCFICGFVVLTVIGVHFRGPNWDFYWSPAQWPGH